MGLHFAHATLKQGHPVAVFLNLDAVKLAARSGEQEKRPSMQRVPREILSDFIKDGVLF
jgi:predicted peroxiredoxin